MRRWLTVALVVLVSACTRVTYDFGDIAPSAQPVRTPPATSTTFPRFGDRKPHPWDGRAPWSYAVHGTDVSKYQRAVDWRQLREAGVSFVFIKATEGGDMVDEQFAEHWRGAKAAGMPRSAYHFFYFCRPAREQAQWFIRNVPKEAGTLPHVLDMEWNHLSPTCRLRPPAATVQREMKVFLDMIERHYGKRPIIYTSVDFYRDNRLHEFAGYDWWLRSVAAHPSEAYPGQSFRFWQYTGTGELPGIKGDSDINVFNGTASQWRAWLRDHGG